MKKIVGLLIVTLLAGPLHAQKYKDLHPELIKATDEEALSMLKSYISEDLDHPNANLKLALIYERRYLDSDPITEYERAMANANEAKLRFTKAAAVVDEREVSKNSGYYAEFAIGYDSKGRPNVDYNVVNQKIRNGYDSANRFTEQLPEIYEYFTRAVNYHDRAIKLFNEINGQFSSRDKLLLLHNANLRFKLEDLIADYDSSIVNLDKYLETGKAYDPKQFNQSYSVKPIETYRLQGLLTSPSFLVENIQIWDYKTWAQDVIKEVETELYDFRLQLDQADLALTNSLKKLNPEVNVANYEPYELDGKLIFNLVKYDNQSLPLALLKYKQHKQDLVYQLGQINDRDTTGSDGILLVNLGELIYKAKDADSLVQIAESRISEENFEKYETFFHTHYKGLPGIKQFITDEKQLAERAKNRGVRLMLEKLSELEEPATDETVTYRRLKLPLAEKSLPVDSLQNDPVTVRIMEAADGSKYLGGMLKKKDTQIVIYIAKTNESNRIQWYKEFSFGEGETINVIGDLALTPEGCAFIARTKAVDGLSNTLYYLNESGEEIFNKPLDLPLYPREIRYVEKTNAFLMVFKGVAHQQVVNQKESMQLMSINILGDILWSENFDFAGSIVDALTLEKGILLIGNYSDITDESGKNYRTKINNNETNAYAARFNNGGKLASLKTISSTTPYIITEVKKVNDRIINLLGNKGTLVAPQDQDIHIIVNHEPNIIHSEF